jgi:hypothetical protein
MSATSSPVRRRLDPALIQAAKDQESIEPLVSSQLSSEIRITSPAPREVWDELYQADDLAVPEQAPAWTDYICRAGGYEDASQLYELPSGKRLILPLVKWGRTPKALSFAASYPPAWGIGGMLASRSIEVEDVATVFDLLGKENYLQVRLRPNPLHAKVWDAARPAKVMAVPRNAHVLDLSGGFDHVWMKRFSPRTRNHVRRAERSGLDIECDTTGRMMPVFYQLFEQSLVRWSKQQNEPEWLALWRGRRRDPLHKLQTMAQVLGQGCRLWVAWHQGCPVASLIVLQGTNAHYTRGAMDKNLAGPLHANELLQRMAIEEACQAGCRHYSMGESGTSASLSHFKENFGAVGHAYAEYYLERFPFTQWDSKLRGFVKSLIGFQDA